MSSPQIENFVKDLKLKGKTLEVGSMDVNGTVKRFFKDYIGLDMRRGKNVDILGKANKLPFKSNSFQNVLYLETIEHDDSFWTSIPEMIRILKPQGNFVLSGPGFYFGHHDYPCDYWRFSKESIKMLLGDLDNVKIEERFNGTFLCVKHKNSEEGNLESDCVTGIFLSPEGFGKMEKDGFAIMPLAGIFATGTKR